MGCVGARAEDEEVVRRRDEGAEVSTGAGVISVGPAGAAG